MGTSAKVRGSLDFRKLSGDGDLGGRHGEGVLAVLFGELHLAALLIQNLDGIQFIALVGLHGDGHGVALGGRLGGNGDGSIFGLIRSDGVAWRAAAATASATGGHRIRRKGAGQNFVVSALLGL